MQNPLFKRAQDVMDIEHNGMRTIQFTITTPEGFADWKVQLDSQGEKLVMQIEDEGRSRSNPKSITDARVLLTRRCQAMRGEFLAHRMSNIQADQAVAAMTTQVVTHFEAIDPTEYQPWWRNQGK